MARRTCPVCGSNNILRPDVKTCSRECSQQWYHWGTEKRAERMRAVNRPIKELSSDDLAKLAVIEEEKELKESLPEMPQTLKNLLEKEEK